MNSISALGVQMHERHFPNLRSVGFKLAMVMLAFALPAHAGAWVPAVHQLYFKISLNQLGTHERFAADGDRFSDEARFEDRNLHLYGEWGLPARWGLFASLAYKSIESIGETERSNSGFGDLEVGVRHVLWQGQGLVSVAGTLKVPYLYEKQDDLRLGNGQEDLELRMLYGRAFRRSYMGAEIGYRWRLDDPADEIRYLIEYGASAAPWYWRTKLDGIESAGSPSDDQDELNPQLQSSFDALRLEVGVGLEVHTHWSVEFTYTHAISGRNTLAGNQFQLGMVLQR